jgi:hypothetical protein
LGAQATCRAVRGYASGRCGAAPGCCDTARAWDTMSDVAWLLMTPFLTSAFDTCAATRVVRERGGWGAGRLRH